jgi:Tol biopolymer transport system component
VTWRLISFYNNHYTWDVEPLIGQTISHYKILAKLSEDATGILYKAVDTSGDRPVALRVLSARITANPEIRQRLERDAMTASALEHPNISRIHEIAHSNGVDFAVVDAPEGESVYDFLERERPQRRYLLRFARQIASALAAAHGAGIVHGPPNTANIFISPKNQIKFYDFGFGILDPSPDSDGARQSLYCQSAPYVSPEQARGSRADAVSDIFSFGALIYHMTTGRLPFRAATVSETWKAIVQDEPKPISQITSRAPQGMDKLLERCLHKNPQRRFQQVSEIEPLLAQIADAYWENPKGQISFFARNRGRIAKIAGISLAATAAVAAIAFLWKNFPQQATTAAPVIGTQIRQMTKDTGFDTEPAFSADGTQFAYASDRNSDGNLDIWIQRADGNHLRQLTNDPADDREPAFSPDNTMIAFRSERDGGGVYLVPVKGGESRLIAREGRRPRYSPDGRWIAYWVGPPGLAPNGVHKTFVIPSGGGEPRQIQPDFAFCTYPTWSPDSKRLIFLGGPDSRQAGPDAVDWWVTALDGEQLRNLGACRLFRRAGVLVNEQLGIPGEWREKSIYFSIPAFAGSNIWRAGVAPDTLEIANDPVRVTPGKDMELQPSTLVNGRILFSRLSYNADIWGLPVSANEGKLTGQAKRWTRDPGIDMAPSLSSDGAKLLFQSNRTGHHSPWLLDLRSGKESPVTSAAQDQLWPMVSPDGSKVVFSEQRIGRFEQFYKPIGTGPQEILCEDCGPSASGWSRDGTAVLIESRPVGGARLSVSLIKLEGRGKTALLADPQYDLSQARFSPDGRWVVFAARSEGSTSRLYLTPYHDRAPLPSREWIAITDGKSWDTAPQWSPDGKLVYFSSTRDSYRCVWAQRLDAANKPSGPAFAVAHFHTARRSPARLPFDMMDLFVGNDQILVSLGDTTGNIWSVKVPE